MLEEALAIRRRLIPNSGQLTHLTFLISGEQTQLVAGSLPASPTRHFRGKKIDMSLGMRRTPFLKPIFHSCWDYSSL